MGAFDYKPAGSQVVVARPSLSNFLAVPNASAPTTKVDMSADCVVFRNAAGLSVVRYNTGVITCDPQASGSIPNGRDRATAWSADAMVYFYFIWNGSRIATLASPTPPNQFDGSSLPGGYTYWAFATAYYSQSAYNTNLNWTRGNRVFEGSRGITPGVGDPSTTQVNRSYTGVVPAIATSVQITVELNILNSAADTFSATIYETTDNVDLRDFLYLTAIAGVTTKTRRSLTLRNSGTLGYKWSAVPSGASSIFVSLTGYTVPNGDS